MRICTLGFLHAVSDSNQLERIGDIWDSLVPLNFPFGSRLHIDILNVLNLSTLEAVEYCKFVISSRSNQIRPPSSSSQINFLFPSDTSVILFAFADPLQTTHGISVRVTSFEVLAFNGYGKSLPLTYCCTRYPGISTVLLTHTENNAY